MIQSLQDAGHRDGNLFGYCQACHAGRVMRSGCYRPGCKGEIHTVFVEEREICEGRRLVKFTIINLVCSECEYEWEAHVPR